MWTLVGYVVGIGSAMFAGGMVVRFWFEERRALAARAARAQVRRAEAEREVVMAPRPPEVVRAEAIAALAVPESGRRPAAVPAARVASTGSAPGRPSANPRPYAPYAPNYPGASVRVTGVATG